MAERTTAELQAGQRQQTGEAQEVREELQVVQAKVAVLEAERQQNRKTALLKLLILQRKEVFATTV